MYGTLGNGEDFAERLEGRSRNARATSATPQKGTYRPDEAIVQGVRGPKPPYDRRVCPAGLDRRPQYVAVFNCNETAVQPDVQNRDSSRDGVSEVEV